MENSDVPNAQQLYRTARRAASRGDYRDALALLTEALENDPAFRNAYRLAADCLGHENRADVAKLLEQAHNSFHSATRFFDVGYRLIDDEHYRPAIPFLMRALELDPYFVDAATELSVAFAATGRVLEAHRALENFDLENHFWAAYQFQWTCILVDDSGDVQDFIDFHRAEIEKPRGRRRPDGETRTKCLECLAELEECLHRRHALGADPETIRDWHFVQHGTVLLACPWADPDDVNCRLVEFSPTMVEVRTMLARLLTYLDRMALCPRTVVAMPGHDAAILAQTLATLLGLPVVPADRENCEQQDTLIVAAHHVELASRSLSRIRRGQVLFAGNVDWSRNALVCPDVAGFVCERLHYPWTGVNLDDRPVEVLATELAATVPAADPAAADMLAYYGTLEPHLKGHANGGSRRVAFMTDTPILPPDVRAIPDDLAALIH